MSLVQHWSHPKQKLSCCLAIQASLRVPVSNKWWWGGGRRHLGGLGCAAPLLTAGQAYSLSRSNNLSCGCRDNKGFQLRRADLKVALFQATPRSSFSRSSPPCFGGAAISFPWASRAATPWSVHYKFLKQVARVLQNIALPFYFICLFPFVPGILISRAV